MNTFLEFSNALQLLTCGATVLNELNENADIVKRFNLIKVIGSTGFSEESQTWYGWSHRAIFGFKIGDKIFEEDFGDDKTKFDQHGSKPCKTLDDCFTSAKAFSSYIS